MDARSKSPPTGLNQPGWIPKPRCDDQNGRAVVARCQRHACHAGRRSASSSLRALSRRQSTDDSAGIQYRATGSRGKCQRPRRPQPGTSGLDYRFHAMGTIVEGEIDQVLAVLKQCHETMADHCDRITCSAKMDFRRGHRNRLESKTASVETKLGRALKK